MSERRLQLKPGALDGLTEAMVESGVSKQMQTRVRNGRSAPSVTFVASLILASGRSFDELFVVIDTGRDVATFLSDAGVSIAWCQTMPVLAYWIPSQRLIILNATADCDELVDEARRLLTECPR